jgi:pimeloyl-ACP methyl ester carboxylesterase
VAEVLAAIDGPVVLVGHSYGGAVISQASASGGNVVHLAYVCAFVPDTGESVLGMARQSPEPNDLGAAMLPGPGDTLVLDPATAPAALYGDVDPARTAAALARLSPQPTATFGQEVAAAGWHDIGSTYVVCTLDRAIPVGLQRQMAERCTNVVELASAHSPFLSMPAALADVLAPLAGS